MDRLSRPLSDLREHYQVIVVGSGYGGGIAASRLSRAHAEVAILERGRELHPGEYPDTVHEAESHLQFATSDGLIGDGRNLYSFHLDDDINVFSGCGLGGTSLVNANVSLRPDRRSFDDPRWPAALRNDLGSLDDAYDRAEEVLRPVDYPATYPALAKVAALERSAGTWPCEPTPINVTFRSGPNAVGVYQPACTGCGDCCTGCNVGSKNTILMNYLPDAVAHGAAVFTEMEVSHLSRRGTGWVVHVQPLGRHRDRFDAPPMALTADIVVVAAGCLGSTGILLRSAANGLPLSARLGERFTGNGDVLGFAYRRGAVVHGTGAGPHQPDPAHLSGPCITAMIDRRAGMDLGQGMIVEDAVIPGLLAPLVPVVLAGQAIPDWLRGHLGGTGPLGMLASVLSHGRRGMLAHTQTYLLMGHDDDHGRMVLRDGRLRIEWPGAGTTAFYDGANDALHESARSSGGTYLRSPIWSRLFGHDLMTVHPLGGAAMADRAEDGVVDHVGRVFSGPSGEGVHDGLYVWDGSIVPVPLGVNPLLTISALAERAATAVVASQGWSEDRVFPAPGMPTAPDTAGATALEPVLPDRPGFRFTEQLTGFWSAPAPDDEDDVGDLEQYQRAAHIGEGQGTELSFVLTMASDDVRALNAQPDLPMTAVGTVSVPALSPEPLTVEGGLFRFRVADDADDRSVHHMRYHLPLVATDGRRFHLDGFKVLHRGDLTDLWPETTTLYFTLRHDGPDGEVVGRGVIVIGAADFLRELHSMHVTGPVGRIERLALKARYGVSVGGKLFYDYGTLVHRSTRFDPGAAPRPHRPLEVPTPEVHWYRTLDGVDLRLTRYRGGNRGPVVLVHGMGANPNTFTLDTIRPNLLEFLVGHGFDVWLQEWRGSTLLPSSEALFDADDVARFDHPAAEAVVRDVTTRRDVHWVTHCVGTMTWLMATLAATTDPASLLCSSVGAHPVAARLTRFKIDLRLGKALWRLGVRYLTTDSYVGESFGAHLLDRALRLYPIPSEERCQSAVCRRLSFIYGVAVHHDALNEPTHQSLHELFGVTNLKMMNHLARCAHANSLVGVDGSDRYMSHLERLERPITFLHGAKNLVWLPESSGSTFDVLASQFSADLYRRQVFDGHGHQDCLMGADSPEHSFPAVLAHLDRVGA